MPLPFTLPPVNNKPYERSEFADLQQVTTWRCRRCDYHHPCENTVKHHIREDCEWRP